MSQLVQYVTEGSGAVVTFAIEDTVFNSTEASPFKFTGAGYEALTTSTRVEISAGGENWQRLKRIGETK